MIIEVNDIPPSGNRFMGKNQRWEYQKYKKSWALLIRAALPFIPNKAYNHAHVHIHYIFPDKRRRDPDNYAGKMILDPLVKYGVLEDDTFNNIRLELTADVIPKTRKTIIEVINLEKSQ